MDQILTFLIFFCCFSARILAETLPIEPDYIPNVQTEMLDVLRQYIQVESNKLEVLKMHIKFMEDREKQPPIKPQNAMNLYKSVKSLADEWHDVREAVLADQEAFKILETLGGDGIAPPNLPTPEHVKEVALAIFRIQDTYILTPADIISNGTSDSGDDGKKASASDCFGIGMIAYECSDYYHALMWLLEAERLFNNEAHPTISQVELWPPLIVSLKKQGNHTRANSLIARLKEQLSTVDDVERKALKKFPDLIDLINDPSPVADAPIENNDTSPWFKKPYENLELVSFYNQDTPFLRLAPAKVEVLHVDPQVLLYRDIISDNESRTLMSIAKGKLKRGRVVKNGIPEYSEGRTSSAAYLGKTDHQLISTLQKRIADYTGLDMRFETTRLQVARYGIGGHYNLHHDYVSDRKGNQSRHGPADQMELNDRMATVMFYLSEPEGGGSTVFPFLNTAVPPSKNDALFWYNLRKDGVGFKLTMHGGCPVISGTKWVANQWIHERGQEFSRPCGLYEDEIDYI